MEMQKQLAPQMYARIAGICYLLIILLGIFGQLVVRGSLLVPGDAAATIANLTASPLLWRLGIIGDIAMHLLDIPVMIILYLLLSTVNKSVALMGLAFNLIQTAVLATNKLALMVPLIMLGSTEYQAATETHALHEQIMLLIEVHNYGFGLGLIFFGCTCLAYGYLIIKSNYFPTLIGILMAAAGLCYVINSVVLIVAPAVSSFVFPILGICLLAELSFSLWLLIKGVNLSAWENRLKKSAGFKSL